MFPVAVFSLSTLIVLYACGQKTDLVNLRMEVVDEISATMVPPTMRGKPAPRWSFGSGRPEIGSMRSVVLPASIAGLPGKRNSVCVGPP